MFEWCQIYTNWVTRLSGHPTVIDCKPDKHGDPLETINELYTLLSTYAPQEALPAPRMGTPELIGRRYRVYKALGGDEENTLYELRAVRDEEEDRLIWAGGVYRLTIHGAPDKPPMEPSLPEPPSDTAPPSTPRGQKVIPRMVVYTAEGKPPERGDAVNVGTYTPQGPDYTNTLELGDKQPVRSVMDFHCVTGWSVKNLDWKGIPLLEILEEAVPRGRWVLALSKGGYSTIVPYDKRILEDAMLVTHSGDQPLPREHGGPARLVFPRLYGWKSLKWVQAILVGDTYLDGYWEARGYHWRGLVILDERFKKYN